LSGNFGAPIIGASQRGAIIVKRAKVDAYPPDTPTYDRDDLEMFKMVLDSAYGEICRKGKFAEVGSGPETVVSLARAIFFHADQGERNPARLKRLVIETVAQPKDIGPGRANVTPLF
jgi:hypothetical protein